MKHSGIVHAIRMLISILLLTGGHIASAQTATEDVVYLKNGSIIRGTILERKEGEFVKIETTGRNVWVFSESEIERITREQVPDQASLSPFMKDKGFLNLTDFGILAGKGEETKDAPFSIHTINGYRFKNGISLGGGVGVEFLQTAYLPLFGEIRYHFMKRASSPFLYMQMGYNLPLEQPAEEYYRVREKGGMLLNPGAGIRFRVNQGTAIILSVSYRYQELKSVLENYWWYQEETNRYEYLHRLALRFGFQFN